MLKTLNLERCSKLEVLPININLGSLEKLDVTGCSQLRSFPEISTNITWLSLCGTSIKEIPLWISSCSKIRGFHITYSKDLEKSPHAFDFITELEFNNIEMEELPSWINGISRLDRLVLNNCRKLVSLPQLPSSLTSLHAENCDSLERLACPFPNPKICLRFVNCWKLNEEARDIIFQTSPSFDATAVLPGKEVPPFFTYRATTGSSLTMRCFPTSLRFKACVLMVNKGEKVAHDEKYTVVSCDMKDKLSGRKIISPWIKEERRLSPPLEEHLYTFEVVGINVESSELFFEFKAKCDKWEIAECGIRELYEEERIQNGA